jgi:hypothetical protein
MTPPTPKDDTVGRYEANAEAFYNDTRVMAPGKDMPAAMSDYDSYDLRVKLWMMWGQLRSARAERDAAVRVIANIEAWLRNGKDTKMRDRWLHAPDGDTGPIIARSYTSDDIVADDLVVLSAALTPTRQTAGDKRYHTAKQVFKAHGVNTDTPTGGPQP